MKTALFGALFSIFLAACAHQHQSPPPASSRWPFTIHAQLSDADIAEIVAIVQRIPDLDHRIVRIETSNTGSVLVHTGEPPGHLSGGGHVVTLEKTHGRWRVVGDWRESIWVS